MTFLNPAVLFGLLAASIPVLIHLLNLRKLKRIDFSTLSFLKELQKNKIRKIKLKQWLLLALRVLIIMMLVMAFARPALKGTTIGGAASSAKTTAVFIVDDTFSMSVIGNRGSYLNQAKETVKNILRQLQEGDEAALILVSDNSDVRTTSSLTDFVKRINDIEVSYSSGMIHNAIVKASEIISGSANFNKEIYLLTDFQQNRLAAERQLSDFSEVLNENVKLYSFNFSGKSVYNLAVTDMKLQTQIFEKDKPVSFDITVRNFSDNDASDVVVSLFSNGERSSQRSIDVAAGKSETFSMEVNLNQTGFIEYSAEIEDDEILQDNQRFLSFYIPEEIPVVVFYENEADIKFLELPLRVAGENNPLKITKRNINQLSSVNLSSFKVVMITGSGNINSIDRLISFAENGGGVLVFPSVNSTPQSFEAFLKNLPLPGLNGVTGKRGDASALNRFNKVDLDHPVFQNIFLNEKKKIESPEIYYNYKILPSGKGRDIISLSDGSSFMSEYSAGRGKYLLFSSLPELSWNNLPLKGIFPPLIYKTVLYLSYTQNIDEENIIAGNALNINLSGKAVPQLLINRPDGSSETINTGGEPFLNYANTGVAGIYTLRANDNIFDKIPVNTDPLESGTEYISESDFKDYLEKIGFKGSFVSIDPSGDPENQIIQARFGSELWKIFAVLTLLLALLEMTIARSMKKDLAVKH
jgi:hypothetical protein